MEPKQTKTTADLTTVTTMSDSQKVIIVDANGANQTITLGDLKLAMLRGINLDSINEGVFIMCHRNSDDYPAMYRPQDWPAQQTAGETAEGVVLVEGGKMLVIAPTESTNIKWSSAEVSGGGVTTSARTTAFNDWAGQANTASQIEHDECSGQDYAPGFCAAYAKTNTAGNGLTAGKWWLPSLGEMMMINANYLKVNYALSKITGSMPLQTSISYWTSTEGSSVYAWHLYLGYGYANYATKATTERRVRPVSAF